MSSLDDLAQRIERLVLRHEELKRVNQLLSQQVGSLTQERDLMRARLTAARQRIDALLERLPVDAPAGASADAVAETLAADLDPAAAQAADPLAPPAPSLDREAA